MKCFYIARLILIMFGSSLSCYSGGCVEGPREGDQINGQIVAENKIIIQLTSELQDNLPSKVEFWY